MVNVSFQSQSLCDFLLVINSNLGPISHRLATIHPVQTDDNACHRRSARQKLDCVSSVQLLRSVYALTTEWTKSPVTTVTITWTCDVIATNKQLKQYTDNNNINNWTIRSKHDRMHALQGRHLAGAGWVLWDPWIYDFNFFPDRVGPA